MFERDVIGLRDRIVFPPRRGGRRGSYRMRPRLTASVGSPARPSSLRDLRCSLWTYRDRTECSGSPCRLSYGIRALAVPQEPPNLRSVGRKGLFRSLRCGRSRLRRAGGVHESLASGNVARRRKCNPIPAAIGGLQTQRASARQGARPNSRSEDRRPSSGTHPLPWPRPKRKEKAPPGQCLGRIPAGCVSSIGKI